MHTTVGQDLLQAITPIQGLFPPLEPLNDQGPLGGYSGPGAITYAPFLRHDDSFLHRLRTGFDASELVEVDCDAEANTDLASRVCYCKFPSGIGDWGIAIAGDSGSPGGQQLAKRK